MPNWDEINRCSIWKTLGVTECNNCDTKKECWGEEIELPAEEERIEFLENYDFMRHR